MFRVAETKDDLIRAICVRAVVFIGEQSCPYDEEIDGLDEEAIHVIGEVGSEPVAAARIRLIGDEAKLERLAVLKEYRQQGIGAALLEYLCALAEQQGRTRLRLHAQVDAEPFYEKQGFVATGPLFLEAGIEHRLMIRDRDR